MEKFVIDFIVNGLIGGLVATFLTLVIRRMWLSIIVPWYEERVYHDAHFEGRWEGTESFSDFMQTTVLGTDARGTGHASAAFSAADLAPFSGATVVIRWVLRVDASDVYATACTTVTID